MKYIIWVLIVALLVVHQDNWNWGKTDLVGGVVPIGLLYHAGISLAAALLWFGATKYCWPDGLDEESSSTEGGK